MTNNLSTYFDLVGLVYIEKGSHADRVVIRRDLDTNEWVFSRGYADLARFASAGAAADFFATSKAV